MMKNDELLIHIANRISNCSRHYTAEVTKEPRSYYGRLAGRVILQKAYGLCITRFKDSHWLPTKAFIFEPDLNDYVTKMSRRNKEFAVRLAMLDLNPDDIELMICTLTFGKIKLFMRGRKIFDDDDGEVKTL